MLRGLLRQSKPAPDTELAIRGAVATQPLSPGSVKGIESLAALNYISLQALDRDDGSRSCGNVI